MAKTPKYYVVWAGQKPGIFNSWDECRQQILGFPGALYKAFPSRVAADKAFAMGYDAYKKGKERITPLDMLGEQYEMVGKPDFNSISVDAACAGNPGVMEYRGVKTGSGEELFRMGPFPEGTVNIGEFLALVHALALLKNKNNKLPVYSDSVNAIKWVKAGKARTKLEPKEKSKKLFELIHRAEKWLAENTYENEIRKWLTKYWGEIPADFGRK
jgi:ribonuclease HI